MHPGMPTPGPEHENLARLTGAWDGDETMFASPWCPDEKRTRGRIRARLFERFFVVSDYEQLEGDAVTFRGHGVYSFDPATSEYVMYWFDTQGGAGGVARGTLDGDVLTFRSRSAQGHHRYRYTFREGETLFEIANSQDGEAWEPMMQARYTPA